MCRKLCAEGMFEQEYTLYCSCITDLVIFLNCPPLNRASVLHSSEADHTPLLAIPSTTPHPHRSTPYHITTSAVCQTAATCLHHPPPRCPLCQPLLLLHPLTRCLHTGQPRTESSLRLHPLGPCRHHLTDHPPVEHPLPHDPLLIPTWTTDHQPKHR